jgi:hypothetical protein
LPDPSECPGNGQDLDPPPVGVGEPVGEDVVLVKEALEVVAEVEAGHEVEEEGAEVVPDGQGQVRARCYKNGMWLLLLNNALALDIFASFFGQNL